MAVAEREPTAIVAERHPLAKPDSGPVKKHHRAPGTRPSACATCRESKTKGPPLRPLVVGGLPCAGRVLWRRHVWRPAVRETRHGCQSPSGEQDNRNHLRRRSRCHARRRRGRQIRATAVNPKTWKKLVLLADARWGDGTRDDINVETLQPPEWIKENNVHIGATVPLPVDLVEMGLPPDLRETVVRVERCPHIEDGPGRVGAGDGQLSKQLRLCVDDQGLRRPRKTIAPRSPRNCPALTRNAWVSTDELRKGERLQGVDGAGRCRPEPVARRPSRLQHGRRGRARIPRVDAWGAGP